MRLRLIADKWQKYGPPGLFVLGFGVIGGLLLVSTHAATPSNSIEAESGTVSSAASKLTDATASGSSAVKFGRAATSSCTNPVYTTNNGGDSWGYNGTIPGVYNAQVNANVWGAGGSWSQQLKVCSLTNWSVTANFTNSGGAIQSYPDTEYDIAPYAGVGKSIAQYNTIQSCYGEATPVSTVGTPTAASGEWDYAYDVWLDTNPVNGRTDGIHNWDAEIMVWNNYTNTDYWPPAGSRAVTIGGVPYHLFKGGGDNEWIYTRDTLAASGCVDMLGIFRDLANNGTATTVDFEGNNNGGQGYKLSSSGITSATIPYAVEFGIELAATNGTQTFEITNASLTVN
jgi:hypothetical protein